MPSSRSRTHFLVGLFVVCGLGLILIIFIWLGVTRYFEKGNYYLCFFDESVQGLSVDAPVKYRGVPVGRVEDIKVAPDGRLIQILIIIESDLSLNKDFVAQVTSVGITGSMFIELDIKEDTEKDLIPNIDFSTKYPVIGSKPSEITRIKNRVEEFLTLINELDLNGLVEKMKGSLDNVNKTLQQAEVKKLSQDIQQAADKVSKLAGMSNWNSTLLTLEEGGREFSQTMQTAQKSLGSGKELINNLDQLVQANEKEMITTLKAMQGMLDRSQCFFEGAQQFIQKSDVRFSQLQSRLLAISQSLERTSANLERLTEIVAENPSRLFFGKPPKPRKLKD